MSRWFVSCPYCNAEFAHGYGNLKVSKVWVPFVRCQYCGQLMKTRSKEYLNMTAEERLKLKSDSKTFHDIMESLRRTNHPEYRDILVEEGYKFYPIAETDEQKFEGVTILLRAKPTTETIQSLYDLGILIKEEVKDENTGGIKQEVLKDRKKQYEHARKIAFWSILAGFATFIIFGITFSNIDSDTDFSFLAIFPAVFAFAVVAIGMNHYYKTKDPTIEEQQKAEKQKREKDTVTCKELLEQCGMQFFIEYFPQIKRLPLRDVIVSDHYFPEREIRLTAAKKIIDLGLTECALRYIIETYGDTLPSETIARAQTILNEIENDKGESK